MEDFDKELQQLVALENAIEQIEALQQQVETEGMSKEVALEAQKLIPGFNQSRPLAYYDASPSFVAEYRTSLESLSEGVALAIAAACAALAALVLHFIAHFFGKKRNAEANSGSFKTTWTYNDHKYDNYADAAAARQKDVDKAFEELKKAREERERKYKADRDARATANASSEKALPDLDVLLEEEAKNPESGISAMLMCDDPFVLDLLHKGTYTSCITSMANYIANFDKHLTKIEAGLTILIRDVEFVINQKGNVSEDQKKELRERTWAVDDVRDADTRGISTPIQIMVERIESSYAAMHDKVQPKKFKYSNLVKNFAEATKRIDGKLLNDAFEDAGKAFPSIQEKLEKLTKIMEGAKAIQDMDDAWHKQYYSTIKQAYTNLDRVVKAAMKFVAHIDRFMRTLRAAEGRMTKLDVLATKVMANAAGGEEGKSPEMKKLEKELLEKLTVNM